MRECWVLNTVKLIFLHVHSSTIISLHKQANFLQSSKTTFPILLSDSLCFQACSFSCLERPAHLKAVGRVQWVAFNKKIVSSLQPPPPPPQVVVIADATYIYK